MKLNKNQLLASGFVNIVMNIVFIFEKKYNFYFLEIRLYNFQPTNTFTICYWKYDINYCRYGLEFLKLKQDVFNE